MPRKILFYTHAFDGGGAEIVFARLAAAFADAGDHVVYAADHDGHVAPRDRGTLRHVRLGAGHIGATRRLAALLREDKPDASFSALGAQNLKHIAAALLCGRLDRCILGYHGFAGVEPKRLSRVSFQATPLMTRLAARTICVSDAILDDIRRRWHGSPTRTLRIYNPVPMVAPAGGVDRDAPPLILACGRLAPTKRFTDLVRAFAEVAPSGARLVIVGDGPEKVRIKAEAVRCAVAGRLDLPGYVVDPSPWYARASCLVISSESESFGLTAAEALAHGTPVVSTDCGGPAEILGHGKYGRIVPVGDIAALAAALSATLGAPGDPSERKRRAQDFSIETIHRAYADLIDSLA